MVWAPTTIESLLSTGLPADGFFRPDGAGGIEQATINASAMDSTGVAQGLAPVADGAGGVTYGQPDGWPGRLPSGNWLYPWPPVTGSGTTDLIAGAQEAHARLYIIGARQTFDQIGTHVSSFVPPATFTLLIWEDAAGYPGSVRLNAGTIDATTGGVKTLAISHTLPPGRYWVGLWTGPSVGSGGNLHRLQSNTSPGTVFSPALDLRGGYVPGLVKTVVATLPDPYPAGATYTAAGACSVFLRAL